MGEAEVGSIVLIGVLLLASGFFSSSEAAFLSLEKVRLTHLVSTGAPGARRVSVMVEEPGRLLSTILLGNNLVNVAFTALVTVLAVALLGEGQGVVAATVIGTAVLLIAGEIIPKTLAVSFAERVAFWYARPLTWIEFVLWPVVSILRFITARTSSAVGADQHQRTSVTERELRTLINVGEAEGTLEPSEAKMLEKVFRFGDRHVREVMTPRTEIVGVETRATVQDFLAIYGSKPHTRFLVYEDDMEHIVGILSAKDILRTMARGGLDYEASVGGMVRQATFVHETKPVAELFDELRRSGHQMTVVVDEHGSVAGIVTLKQLSEKVMGPIGEEGTGPRTGYDLVTRDTFRVEGRMAIDEANDALGLNLPEGDYETVAGFALEILGRIPAEGDRFAYGELAFRVTRMEGLRIRAVEVTRTRPSEDVVQRQADPKSGEPDDGR
jgi:CBS domain containing-hemolysin-like protein